jgi:hypothetical protein
MTHKLFLFTKLTTHNLLVAIVFIAIFTMAARVPADSDTWWHVRSGQYIVENLTIPTTDPFSHTQAGRLWIDHGWLAQIFWYSLYALGGWAAVALALAALVTLAFWFVWRQINEANVFVAGLAMILGAIVSSVVWAARPQMVSFLLTAIVAYLLDRFKRHNGGLLPWLPVVILLWANIHGGFAIGFMLMFAYLAGEAVNNITKHTEDPVVSWSRLKHLLLSMVISLAVVVINPHTWRMWLYPFQTVGISALRDFIQEWQSPNFHLIWVQPFILMLLLVIAALARTRHSADWTDLALIAMWTAWALFASRNIAIFGLVITPVLARYADLAWIEQWQVWGFSQPPFSRQRSVASSQQSVVSNQQSVVSSQQSVVSSQNSKLKTRNPKLILNWLLLGLIIIAALIKIALPLTPGANLKAEQDSMPYTAVEFIQQNRPAGPMFNSYNWGGYLIFKLWPAYPVYIDGRTDLYDDAFIRRYLSVMVADEGWEQILADDGINLVFVEKDSVLDKFLWQNSDWTEIYRDEKAAIFTRMTP